jgi:hypothetical protein
MALLVIGFSCSIDQSIVGGDFFPEIHHPDRCGGFHIAEAPIGGELLEALGLVDRVGIEGGVQEACTSPFSS